MDAATPPKRIVFAGSDAIALPLLEDLSLNSSCWQLAGIVSQPDRPAGRGRQLQANPVTSWARERGLPLNQPEKARDGLAEWLISLACDTLLVLAYGQILPPAVLQAPTGGAYNFHGSLLPHLRGASPIETAIATGDTITGMAFMQMVAALDAGAIAAVEEVSISRRATGPSLREDMAAATARLWNRVEKSLFLGQLSFTEQDPSQATFCRKLIKEDGRADFSLPAAVLEARFRAFHPWPGFWFPHGEGVIKVGACEAAGATNPDSNFPAGTVLLASNEGLLVQTGQGLLRLTHLQRPGGRMLPAADFLRGYSLTVGEQLASTPSLPLVANRPFPRSFFDDPHGFQ
jgi:methionyl-tRNA formyltransferase